MPELQKWKTILNRAMSKAGKVYSAMTVRKKLAGSLISVHGKNQKSGEIGDMQK
jgi:hypothetical protein